MDTVHFSTKQLFVLLSTTAVSAVAVFSLGLLVATLITDKADSNAVDLVATEAKIVTASTTCADQSLQVSSATTNQPLIEVSADRPRFGVQIAVFETLENAIALAKLRSDEQFHARVYSRPASESKTVYPVLIGLFGNMDDAQKAKHSFHEKFSADSFVTDATKLREEVLLGQTMAMLN